MLTHENGVSINDDDDYDCYWNATLCKKGKYDLYLTFYITQ
jgi:hypothetical protein